MSTVNYKIMLFANIRDTIGIDYWSCEAKSIQTGQELINTFFDNYPNLEGLRKLTRIAVEREFSDLNLMIDPSCEIAFIPPVSGG